MTTYFESFDDGPGGWYGYQDGPGQNKRALEWSPGSLTSRSPWWIDYNHAPPGIGYFHMLGSRHDRTDMYGVKPLERVLSKADVNIMFLLYPINVVPMGPIDGDMQIEFQ